MTSELPCDPAGRPMVWFAASRLSGPPDPKAGSVNVAPLTVSFPPGSQPAFLRSCSPNEKFQPSALAVPEMAELLEIISLSKL